MKNGFWLFVGILLAGIVFYVVDQMRDMGGPSMSPYVLTASAPLTSGNPTFSADGLTQPLVATPLVSVAELATQQSQQVVIPPTPTMQAMIMVDTPLPAPQVEPTMPTYIELKTCSATGIFKTTSMDQQYFVGAVGEGITLQVTSRSPDMQWVKLLQGSDNLELWVPAAAFCFENPN